MRGPRRPRKVWKNNGPRLLQPDRRAGRAGMHTEARDRVRSRKGTGRRRCGALHLATSLRVHCFFGFYAGEARVIARWPVRETSDRYGSLALLRKLKKAPAVLQTRLESIRFVRVVNLMQPISLGSSAAWQSGSISSLVMGAGKAWVTESGPVAEAGIKAAGGASGERLLRPQGDGCCRQQRKSRCCKQSVFHRPVHLDVHASLHWTGVRRPLTPPPLWIKAKNLRRHCAVLIIGQEFVALHAIRSISRSSCIHADELKCEDRHDHPQRSACEVDAMANVSGTYSLFFSSR
jgi:hypothetical protein